MNTKTSIPAPARVAPASSMTPTAASRIQGATAKGNGGGGGVAKGSFAARAQSAAAKGGKR